MSIWDRLLYLIGKRPTPDPRTYHLELSDSLQVSLSTIAKNEGRPEHELIPEILCPCEPEILNFPNARNPCHIAAMFYTNLITTARMKREGAF